jgi:uncharacterized protein YndB with AHSA1/START domain
MVFEIVVYSMFAFVFVVACIVICPLIVGLFIKEKYDLKREIVINRPADQVFDYLKLLKNTTYFSKWVMIDPNVVKTFKGSEDGSVGAIYAWDSQDKKVGKGEQEITSITEHKRIDYEIRFEKPFKNTSQSYLTTESISENQTKVTWGFGGKMAYPMNVMLLVLNMDKLLGGDIMEGLENLKKVLEK